MLYLYDELQFHTDDIPSMLVDDEGNSLVISARGGELTDGIHVLDNGKFFNKSNNSDKKWFDLYLEVKYLTIEEKVATFKDQSTIDVVNHLVAMGESKYVKHLMILAYSDGTEFEGDLAPVIVKIKSGGPEVVAEYMLSRFIENYKRLESSEINESAIDLRIEANRNEDSNHKFAFDFDLDGDLSQLEIIDDSRTEVELDGTVWDGSFRRFQLNINEDAVYELNEKFNIPSRIRDILTQEQIDLLNNQAPQILIENMDFIGLKIFNQQLDSFESYNKQMESRVYAENWGKSTYNLLGEDGAYLGNDLTLNKDGSIDD